ETVVVTEEDEEEDCVTCAIKTSFDDIVSEIMELLEDRTMAMKLLNLKKDERSNIEIMEFLNNVYLSLDTHNENFSFHSVADLDFKFDMNEILLRSAFNGTYTGPIAYENSLGVNPFNTVYDLDINWMNYFNPLGNGEYNYRHTGRAPTQLFRGPNVYQSHYNQRIPIDNFTFHSERPNLGIGIPFLLQ
ncbi:MAG: hypothetical protein KAQ98_05550, partial [Bacteriovoracaceae bacterium]|nr:hypothetical protein [Bacteriovoracaceae bacterium]